MATHGAGVVTAGVANVGGLKCCCPKCDYCSSHGGDLPNSLTITLLNTDSPTATLYDYDYINGTYTLTFDGAAWVYGAPITSSGMLAATPRNTVFYIQFACASSGVFTCIVESLPDQTTSVGARSSWERWQATFNMANAVNTCSPVYLENDALAGYGGILRRFNTGGSTTAPIAYPRVFSSPGGNNLADVTISI